MGRTLMKINNISLPYSFNTSALKVGVYLIRIANENSEFVKIIEKR